MFRRFWPLLLIPCLAACDYIEGSQIADALGSDYKVTTVKRGWTIYCSGASIPNPQSFLVPRDNSVEGAVSIARRKCHTPLEQRVKPQAKRNSATEKVIPAAAASPPAVARSNLEGLVITECKSRGTPTSTTVAKKLVRNLDGNAEMVAAWIMMGCDPTF